MKLVLVTGGCGYIGVHTIVELLREGYEAVSLDNNVRSSERILEGVERITGKRVRNVRVDLRDAAATEHACSAFHDVLAVIHFAAFKTVPESVAQPLLYYDNNLNSLVNILRCTRDSHIPNFIFSSSCSVYGNTPGLPVSEETPFGAAECPYARTKQMGEMIIQDSARAAADTSFVSLRYFNPAGAHPSIEIGEALFGKPENLVPAITQFASGRMPELVVHGTDYPTRDGTCVRDYVHVSDIARAHVRALRCLEERGSNQRLMPMDPGSNLNYAVFNLGSGQGVSVLEAIRAFEKVSGRRLNYRIGPRRAGDVASVHADCTKAALWLDWKPEFTVEDMMQTAWHWELKQQRALRPTVEARRRPVPAMVLPEPQAFPVR